ncbi:hypothetical protein VM1G_08907 [Cytospora mali]|uniref:Uncharacterized protein n=1 Tax=Cytospora mali TaxID=578113 RepID=A0A194WA67_CYTMA|nr:hypothetical protein VM1G_08907 [Valsa mali]
MASYPWKVLPPPTPVPPIQVPDWQNKTLFPEPDGHTDDYHKYKYKHHHWQPHKFGMVMEDMFTTLPRQFNLVALPLLDIEDFGNDVAEISHISKDKEEFLRRMAERRDQRHRELARVWDDAWAHMPADKGGLDFDYPGKWQAVNRIRRYRSLQSQVAFVAGHLPADAMEEGPEMARLLPKTCSRDSSPASFVTARTHLSSDHDVVLPSGPHSGETRETQVPPKGIFARYNPRPRSSPNGSRPASEGAPGTRWSSPERTDKPVVGPYAFYVPTVQESLDSEQSQSMGSPSASATSGGKRKMTSEEEEDYDQLQGSGAQGQPAAKKRRTGANARLPSASAMSAGKRKMAHEEEEASLAQGQSATKKRKTNANARLPSASATLGGKRKMAYEEEEVSSTQGRSAAKKRKTNSNENSLSASTTSGGKRKMAYEKENHDQSRTSNAKGHSAAKKGRIATSRTPPPAAATSADEGKGDRKEDSAAQEQAKTVVAKKRRAGKDTKPPQASALPGSQPTRGASAVARVTRAQRRLLSEENAQLFRLGQHGELDVQGIADQAQEDDVSNNTASGRLK